MAQFLQYKAGDQRVASSRLFGVTVLCPYSLLSTGQNKKTENRPDMTEKTLTGT